MCNAVVAEIDKRYDSIELTDNCSNEIPSITIDSEDINSITYLNLDGKIISDITGIEGFVSLIDLELYNNQISDFSPLSSLTSLTELDLDSTQISDLTPLSNLTSLTKLDLNNNQISDLSPLENLVRLTWLNLGSNQISDLTPLSKLVKLDHLRLYGNPLNDITPILSLGLAGEPFQGGFNVSTVTSNSREYDLPSLFLLYNDALEVSPVAPWVTEAQDGVRQMRDAGMFTTDPQNLKVNEDGKGITILNIDEPAVLSYHLSVAGQDYLIAQITIIYEEPEPVDPEDLVVPDTGKNTKKSSTATLTATLCILSGIILAAIPMTRLYRKTREQ